MKFYIEMIEAGVYHIMHEGKFIAEFPTWEAAEAAAVSMGSWFGA